MKREPNTHLHAKLHHPVEVVSCSIGVVQRALAENVGESVEDDAASRVSVASRATRLLKWEKLGATNLVKPGSSSP